MGKKTVTAGDTSYLCAVWLNSRRSIVRGVEAYSVVLFISSFFGPVDVPAS